jgi:hypothetical protein
MRVCFVVLAGRLVVILALRQVVVTLSVVIRDHGAAPCLAFEAVCEASAIHQLAMFPQLLLMASGNSFVPLLVASSSSGVSTALAGRCT